MIDPLYKSLADVLAEALAQAASGKGKERHAGPGEPFERQQICQVPRWQGHVGGPVFQICKKAVESERLPEERAIVELLGAINYAAAAVIVLREKIAARAAK